MKPKREPKNETIAKATPVFTSNSVKSGGSVIASSIAKNASIITVEDIRIYKLSLKDI